MKKSHINHVERVLVSERVRFENAVCKVSNYQPIASNQCQFQSKHIFSPSIQIYRIVFFSIIVRLAINHRAMCTVSARVFVCSAIYSTIYKIRVHR